MSPGPTPSTDDTSPSGGVDELAALAIAARDGDRDAFEELVRRTTNSTYTLALRLTNNEEDARDVVQETYLRAYRGLKNYRGDAAFTTWLYRICANCSSTFLTTRGRHRHSDFADVERQSEASELKDQVADALAELPPRLRAVIVLRDVYDLPHDAIAAELGISVSAAKVRLHRARHKLRTQIFPELDEIDVRAM